jgi:hypothetical protein
MYEFVVELGCAWRLNLAAFLWARAFRGNTPVNCLLFGAAVQGSDIQCLGVVNNSCHSMNNVPGLVFARSTLCLSDCVFRRNIFDYFVGCCAVRQPIVSFVGSVFDVWSLRVTGDFLLSTASCQHEMGPTSHGICRTEIAAEGLAADEKEARVRLPAADPEGSSPPSRSSIRNRSVSPTRSQSPNPKRSQSPNPTISQSPNPKRSQSPNPTISQSPNPMRSQSPRPTRGQTRTPTAIQIQVQRERLAQSVTPMAVTFC